MVFVPPEFSMSENSILSPDTNTLTLDAVIIQQTNLMPAVGVRDVTISAHSVIKRANSGMELALVLDNTPYPGQYSGLHMILVSSSTVHCLKTAYVAYRPNYSTCFQKLASAE